MSDYTIVEIICYHFVVWMHVPFLLLSYVLFSENTIKSLWCRLRKDDPEMSSNFEEFLYKISTEIRKSKSDFDTLEGALKR